MADLEEISPSPGRPPCSTLFQEAILCARKHYNNQHVYPYTYQAGYFYRHNMYKEAFESWANASDVIRQLVCYYYYFMKLLFFLLNHI